MKAGPRLGPQCLDGRRRTSCGGFPRISFRSACPSLLCCPGAGQRQAAWLGTMAQGAFEYRKHPMDGPTHAGFPHSEVGLPTGDSPEEFFVRSGDLISPSRDQACCPNLDLEWQAGSRPRIRSAAQKHRRRPTTPELTNTRVAVIATDGFEESELTEPVKALKDAATTVEVVSPSSGQVQALRHHGKSITGPVHMTGNVPGS